LLDHCPDKNAKPANESPAEKNITKKYKAAMRHVPFIGDDGWKKIKYERKNQNGEPKKIHINLSLCCLRFFANENLQNSSL